MKTQTLKDTLGMGKTYLSIPAFWGIYYQQPLIVLGSFMLAGMIFIVECGIE